jgi:hypothetical protein
MIEEGAKQVAKKKQEQQCKQKQEAAAAETEENADKDKKPLKDRSNYKCWSCGEMGHLANSKPCPNYKKKTAEREVIANATWQDYEAKQINSQ